MHTIVCIKQVPETTNVRMDEKTGTMVREGVESIVNPFDLYAIEAALRLGESHGGRVTVISMGPKSAEKAVREALAMGCDRGVLLCDSAFAGSDSHATSHVLAGAIRELAPYDLVLTGARATDGETAQVGPGIAAWLNLPLATFVSRLPVPDGQTVTVDRLVETGYEGLRLPLPCLLTVTKEICEPRLPTLRGKQRARRAELAVWGPGQMNLRPEFLGLEGSPTRVVKITRPRVARTAEMVDADKTGPQQAARALVDFLEENDLL